MLPQYTGGSWPTPRARALRRCRTTTRGTSTTPTSATRPGSTAGWPAPTAIASAENSSDAWPRAGMPHNTGLRVEERNTQRWERLFREAGRPLPPYDVSRRTRLLAWVAKTFGPSSVLPLILAEEGREVQSYLGLARSSSHQQTHQAAIDIAADSAVHARELSEVM